MRAIWRRSLQQRLAGAGVLHLDRDRRDRRARPPCAPGRSTRPRSGRRRARRTASRQSGPRSAARTGVHRLSVGSGGAASCSRVSAARYGAGQLVGQRRLEDRHRLAELHRPALELAEGAEELLGGALLDLGQHERRRACRRAACRSPSAVRPAYPRGSAASFTVLLTGLRGTSFTLLFSVNLGTFIPNGRVVICTPTIPARRAARLRAAASGPPCCPDRYNTAQA